MKNDAGKVVDLYIPRKCSWTRKLIPAFDKASIQINIGDLDENGVYCGTYKTFAICGKTRSMGEADSAIDHLYQKACQQGKGRH